jgi:hypothetical protein
LKLSGKRAGPAPLPTLQRGLSFDTTDPVAQLNNKKSALQATDKSV